MFPSVYTRVLLTACITLLVGCGDGDSVDRRTALAVLVQTVAPTEVFGVEYSIQCIETAAAFDSPVEVFDGTLEIPDGRGGKVGQSSVVTKTWLGALDLPPGSCGAEILGIDEDGEVICLAAVPFRVSADIQTQVVVPLRCPSAVNGGNRYTPNQCPEVSVFRCDEPASLAADTSCELRVRDLDGTCADGCDPQQCDSTVFPLVCGAGPDRGVSATVTCDTGILDCTGDGVPDGSCAFDAQTFADDLTGGFDITCPPQSSPQMTTCTVTATDGDLDCDMSEVLTFGCRDPNL